MRAAVPRYFDLDILTQVVEESNLLSLENQFEWLKKQPFVSQRERGWQYHEVVRRYMLHYFRHRSKSEYQQVHESLALYFNGKLNELESKNLKWINENWRASLIDYLYHHIHASPDDRWGEFVSTFAISLQKYGSLSQKLLDIFSHSGGQDVLSHEQKKDVEFFSHQLQTLKQQGLKAGLPLLNRLCQMPQITNEALVCALTLRGEAYRRLARLSEAVMDLDKAIELEPNNFMALAERGESYHLLKQHDKALEDFDKALSINSNYHSAYDRKGFLLYSIRRYEEAIKVLSEAQKTNKKCVFCITCRGDSNRALGNYSEALSDFDTALKMKNANKPWVLIRRGEVYRQLQQFERAINDFKKAQELDPNYEHESLKEIGLTLQKMGNHAAAMDSFIASLKVVPDCYHCWTALTISYCRLYPRSEAPKFLASLPLEDNDKRSSIVRLRVLADLGFDSARQELEKLEGTNEATSNQKDHNSLGLALCRLGRYAEAINSFNKATENEPFTTQYNVAVAIVLWKGVSKAKNQLTVARNSLGLFLNKIRSAERFLALLWRKFNKEQLY